MLIVIPFKERLNYLKITLATLKEACRDYNPTIVLYNTDDSPDQSDLEIFKEFDNLVVNHNIKVNKHVLDIRKDGRRINLDTLLPTVINDAFKDYKDEEYMILLDSDTVVHPNAIEEFEKMYKELPNLGIGTLFNSNHWKFKDTDNKNYGIKEIIGGFGLIIKKEAWKKHGMSIDTDWDVLISKNVRNCPHYAIYCTIRSYLEHIGMDGTHKFKENEVGHPLSIDRASNFFD